MRVWLDDTRDAPDGWLRARTVDDAIRMLRTGNVTELSLDYNLTHSDSRHGSEVMDFLWSNKDRMEIPVLHIHSANPFGAAHLALYIRSFEGRAEPDAESLYDMLDGASAGAA